jgi:multidrug efflux pump subunit AcrA (membrane-fusion protein)
MLRARAIQEYRDPSQRGGLVRVLPARGVWVLALWSAVALTLVVLAAFAEVEVRVTATGVVRGREDARVVRAPAAGVVRAVPVAVGEAVPAGATVVELEGRRVAAPLAGVAGFVAARVGERVEAGDPLVKLVPADARPVASLLVPAAERPRIAAGQAVRLRVGGATRAGTVTRVARDLAAPALEGERLQLPISGPSYVVEVALADAAGLAAGTYLEGHVVVGRRSLVSLLLPGAG